MSTGNEWGKTSQEQAYEPFGTAPSDPLWTPPPVAEEPVAEPWYRKGPPIKTTLKWIMYIWIIVFMALALVGFISGFVGALAEDIGQ